MSLWAERLRWLGYGVALSFGIWCLAHAWALAETP